MRFSNSTSGHPVETGPSALTACSIPNPLALKVAETLVLNVAETLVLNMAETLVLNVAETLVSAASTLVSTLFAPEGDEAATKADRAATKADGAATKADGAATKADGAATKADGAATVRERSSGRPFHPPARRAYHLRALRSFGPLLLLLSSPAWAIEKVPSEPVELLLTVGKGIVIDCPKGVVRVATSSPEIVDVVAASTQEVLLHAKTLGQATVFIWSKSGERIIYNVTVEPNLEPLRRLVRETFPDEEIDIRASRDSLALIGTASSQAVADRALALVVSSVKGAVSNLKIARGSAEKQVVLHVKFAELNRTAVVEFGVNLLSTGANTIGRVTTGQFASGGVSQVTGSAPGTSAAATTFSLSDMLNIFAFRRDLNLGVLIRDLQTRGLLQILAEPNLVATNGKEASFLAGGEFPVPIAQAGANGGAISVMFREYGIKLSFLPQVTGHETIRLHVKPEVSSIDSGNGVTVSGLNIPALATRRIETDIELGTGQSFVIGGLIDDRVIENLSQVPGLSHVPILGALFKTRSLTKSKTELIVVVTPELATPESLCGGTTNPPCPGNPLQRITTTPAMPVPFLTPAETPPTVLPKAKK